ncbi:hypothetical protein [Tumebacillus lipolyticus]|uniref:Uncharacterized protein n=1 Tax=Tumebacillus lipolyticus TaxID=1280370 RepID=A0ABW4ZYG9_9BACL
MATPPLFGGGRAKGYRPFTAGKAEEVKKETAKRRLFLRGITRSAA